MSAQLSWSEAKGYHLQEVMCHPASVPRGTVPGATPASFSAALPENGPALTPGEPASRGTRDDATGIALSPDRQSASLYL